MFSNVAIQLSKNLSEISILRSQYRRSVETSTLETRSAWDVYFQHPVAASWELKFRTRANHQSQIANRQYHGGGEGIRTPDPMVANHVLCQLSYTPDNLKFQIWDLKSQRLVAGAGFEPATFGLWAQRATGLLHPAPKSTVTDSVDFNPLDWATASRLPKP